MFFSTIPNKSTAATEDLDQMLNSNEKVLYNKYYNIILNTGNLLHRTFSDEKLENVIYHYKRYIKYSGNSISKIELKATVMELQRRRNNKKIEDIDVNIPQFFPPEFGKQNFRSDMLSGDQLWEIVDLFLS